MTTQQQIPKVLHFIWIGDESKRPDSLIESWRKHHPDWELRIWGNAEYESHAWKLRHHMEAMWNHELPGVADMMRYEILAEHGGIYLDADTECLAPLPEWLLECEAFCISENELEKPELLANGFLGTKAHNPFFTALIQAVADKEDVVRPRRHFWQRRRKIAAWRSVGPLFFTKEYKNFEYHNLTILPSHFFLPNHYDSTSSPYSGGGPVYCKHFWGNTRIYDTEREKEAQRAMPKSTEQQIPKILHFIWIGDESKRPDHLFEGWRKHHPDWELRVWGNAEYESHAWKLRHHMKEMWNHDLAGVADMMRYEIVAEFGGIYLDADTECLAPLPEWMLKCEAFCASENELVAPGRLGNNVLGSKPANPFFAYLIDTLAANEYALYGRKRAFRQRRVRASWRSVGPLFFTQAFHTFKYRNLTILPSHFFSPRHGDEDDLRYTGGGPIYANHLWSGSRHEYDDTQARMFRDPKDS